MEERGSGETYLASPVFTSSEVHGIKEPNRDDQVDVLEMEAIEWGGQSHAASL